MPPTRTSEPDGDLTLERRLAALPALGLVLLVLATLGLFLGKPLGIDDPLFVWTARELLSHPANPYDFSVNWYGKLQPMWEVTKNPPFGSYYLALFGRVLGWSESALHAALLLPALAAALGAHRLACRLTERPFLAAAAAVLTPVFLVSGTTLMCDVLMQALWIWAVVLWMEGEERDDSRRLAAAALLVSMAVATKYFAVCLVPLLATWSLLGKRTGRVARLAWLAVPLLAMAAYQAATTALYGRGLLSDAGGYARAVREQFGVAGFHQGLTALAFTGGCLAMTVFFAPVLWRLRDLAFGALGVGLLSAALYEWSPLVAKVAAHGVSSPAFVAIQLAFWTVGGLGVLALATLELRTRRDADTWLLVLWTWGTFLFTAFFNWTVNARSILPMAVPVGILLARRVGPLSHPRKRWIARGALAAGAALALFVARADLLQATAVRTIAREACAAYASTGRPLWFQGHWGFQYYMQEAGAVALDLDNQQIGPGDRIALPVRNTNVFAFKPGLAAEEQTFRARGPRGLATMNGTVGAGFYASVIGPLPFAFGRILPEEVVVFVVERSEP